MLYSLLKKYLRVTSVSREKASSESILGSQGVADLQQDDFKTFSMLFELVSEFLSVLNLTGEWKEEGEGRGKGKAGPGKKALRGVPILTGTYSPELLLEKMRRKYKVRSDFVTDREYGDYVKSVLRPEMRIKACQSYESIHEGDTGVYKCCNDGTPPVQCTWDHLGGDTYWVYWYQIEMLSDGPLREREREGVCICSVVCNMHGSPGWNPVVS